MPKRAVVPEDLLRFRYLSDPQISPDGQSVIFLHKQLGEKNKYQNRIWIVSRTSEPRMVLEDGANQATGRWSPDGNHIAFIRTVEKEAPQIWVMRQDGSGPTALSELPEGSFGGMKWSPNGSKIAFTFRETHPDFTEQAKKRREDTGESTPPRITEKPNYRLDGDGYYMEQRYKLYCLELATKQIKLVDGECPLGSYTFDWSPDSSKLIYTRSTVSNPWSDPDSDQVFVSDLEHAPSQLASQPGYKTQLCCSPDGKWLAFLGHEDPNDHRGVSNCEVFVMPAEGGTVRSLTHDTDFNFDTSTNSDSADFSADFLTWSADSTRLYARLGAFGETQLAEVSLEGKVRMVTEGQHALAFGNLSSDGKTAAVIYTDPTQIGEVALIDLDSPAPEPKRLTRLNDSVLADLMIQAPEEHWIPSTDGKKVHTWVIKPVGFEAGKTYPAALEVHGGPQMQYGWTFFHEFQTLAAADYVVVYSNPRGGKGYGEEHVRAIAGRWGGKDWEDIAAVKDWMKSQEYIDSSRIGIMGGSYGGYVVNWAVGHTNDFKSAITDRCVSNLVSKAGNSDYPYFSGSYWKGKAYGDLESIADLWRDSPIAYFDRVKTPMLIIHSEGDLRCNIEQSEQVFSALQEQGIMTRFVRYPVNTSHGMSRNGPADLRIHRLNEILSWWKRTL
ncbi:MAG: S9 family peptidase [Fimbriimonadaceae bacterium]|nr:S9 family peptidase [Fimbriimonadaceae bacterium]